MREGQKGSCPSGKRCYSSKAHAKRGAKKAQKESSGRKGHTDRLIPYQCHHCGDWHLTKRDNYNLTQRRTGARSQAMRQVGGPAEQHKVHYMYSPVYRSRWEGGQIRWDEVVAAELSEWTPCGRPHGPQFDSEGLKKTLDSSEVTCWVCKNSEVYQWARAQQALKLDWEQELEAV